MSKPSKGLNSLVKFFGAKGRENHPRAQSLDEFTHEEFVALIQLLANDRDAHDLIAYINTNSANCKLVTVEDIVEARKILVVKSVLGT